MSILTIEACIIRVQSGSLMIGVLFEFKVSIHTASRISHVASFVELRLGLGLWLWLGHTATGEAGRAYIISFVLAALNRVVLRLS